MRWIGFFSLLLLLSTSAGAVTLTDGNFSATDWNTVVLKAAGPEVGTTVTIATGGDPAAHREIYTESPSFGCCRRVMVIDLYVATTVNPGSLGGIASVDHFEDQKCASGDGCAGAGQAWYPAIAQGSNYYVAVGQTIGVQENWVSVSRTGMVATDFERVSVTTSGLTVPGSHPDFSPTGGVITLGYARANTNAVGRTGRIDDWRAVITGTPVSTEQVSFSMAKARYGERNWRSGSSGASVGEARARGAEPAGGLL